MIRAMDNGGNQFSGVYLKLDLYNNEVHYRDPKGNELVAVTPIQKLILFDSSSQLVFNFIKETSDVLSDKKTK